MMRAPIPGNELRRLEELYRYEILDTPAEEDFNEIVLLASRICRTPMSDITLIDAERQWFKARVMPGVPETPRDISFCAHAISQDDLFEVSDAAKDERFATNPLVLQDPHIRFYAGVPLVTPGGYNLGTLCVVDRSPKYLNDTQRDALRVLAKQVMKLIELHRQNRELRHYVKVEQGLRKELERVTGVQQTMMSIIGHDVRGPLGAVKSVIELFEEETLEAADMLKLMPVASRQMEGTLHLLDNIVDWGMLQIRQGALQRKAFTLYSMVDEIVALSEGRLLTKGNTLVNAVDPGLEAVSDPNALQFILRNLIDNAGKFTLSGTIAIEALDHGEGDALEIRIRDTGVGMEESVRQQLFQSSPSRHSTKGTGEEKGSGLGLFLCKQFMDELGGSISVESEVGVGTTVKLHLPR
jgi:signal transduction histidine kinase